MGSNRQPTLAETWTSKSDSPFGGSSRRGNGSSGRGTYQLRGQSRGRGASSKSSNSTPSGKGNSKAKRGTGGKRGRGRGNEIRMPDHTFYDDDDDALCQALGQFELADSEVAKALETGASAKVIPGFEPTAGETWIYPTNRPVRDYQFNITKTALFHNTLVSLPTGLGKTFIAAVVMYNYYRWFPNDIIVFMAPTRPLVAQQLDACHNIVGINPAVTVELTGQILPAKREALWKEKRVFFLTPQVIQSDIARNFCATEKIRCIVIDEAHKALGNHSYAQVIASIIQKNCHFRVLALSATPGNDPSAVQQVLKNLLISHVEIRSEKSPDVLPYVHERDVETKVLYLDQFSLSIHGEIRDIFDMYTGKLMQQKILPKNGSTFVAYQLLQSRQRFRTCPPPHVGQHERGYIEVAFFVCISLARAIELLNIHGLRSFYLFLKGLLMREKGSAVVATELKKKGVESILDKIQEKLNISIENSSFNISTSGLFDTLNESDIPAMVQLPSSNIDDYLQSHPKMKALKEIVEDHFRSYAVTNESTRVMIFSQYRDSVQEIGNLLNLLKPRVKPMVFMGQAKSSGAGGRGLKQKEQIQVVQKFKDGGFNVLVATSVGEEGLDIGDVDLIICFDSNKSPTRNIQRMGRTGRQRQGKIIFLLTEGREERLYRESVTQQSSIQRSIMDTSKLKSYLYPKSPRMIPEGIQPQCFKMSIILSSEQENYSRRLSSSKLDEETFDDSDFIRPTGAALKIKKTISKKADTNKNISTPQFNTITRCIRNMETKQKAAGSKVSTETILIDDDAPILSPPERDLDHLGMVDDSYDFLCSVFDICDINSETSAAPCVQIPLKTTNFVWKSEYDKVPFPDVLLSDIQMQTAIELVDSNVLMGSFEGYCKCGNAGSADSTFMENFNDNNDPFADDFDTESSFRNDYTRSVVKKSLIEVQPTVLPNVSLSLQSTGKGRRDTLQSESVPVVVPVSEPISASLSEYFADDIDFEGLSDFDDGFIFDDENDPRSTDTDVSNIGQREIEDKTVETVTFVNFQRSPAPREITVKTLNNRANNVPKTVADDSSTASESEFGGNTSFTSNFSQVSPIVACTTDKLNQPSFSYKCKQTNASRFLVPQLSGDRSLDHQMPSSSSRHSRSSSEHGKAPVRETSVKSASPDMGVQRRKFTFKKITSTGMLSLHSTPVNDDSILDETIVKGTQVSSSAPTTTTDCQSTRNLTSKNCYKKNYKPRESSTNDLDYSEIDVIPATSSDEDNLLCIDEAVARECDKDFDSDATNWDPEELPGTPPQSKSKSNAFSGIRLQNSDAKSEKNDSDFVYSPDRRNYRLDSQIRNTLKRSFKYKPHSAAPSRCPSRSQAKEKSTSPVQNLETFPTEVTLYSRASVVSSKGANEKLSESEVEFLCSIPKSRSGNSSPKPKDSSDMSTCTEKNITPPIKKFRFCSKPTTSSSMFSPRTFPSPSATINLSCYYPSPARHASTSYNTCITPVRTPRTNVVSSPESEDFILNKRKPARRMIISSEERTTKNRTPAREKKIKTRRKNPFVFDEAVGTSDDSSMEDCDGTNSIDDSFVVHGEDDDDFELVTATQQQAMYLQSVKDVIPARLGGRIEDPLPPNVGAYSDDMLEYFNYADVGVFTQCMNDAKEELEREKKSGKSTRKLRSRR